MNVTALARTVRWLYVAAAGVIVLAVVATVAWLGPLPPKTVVISTGTPGSDYELFARRYKAILNHSGVDLRLLPSAGGVENLRRLNDPTSGVEVGFAQSGLTSEAQSPDLESLGTVSYEPFWFFYRGQAPRDLRSALSGKRVAVGPPGGGTEALALEFLRLNGFDQNIAQLLPLTMEQSGDALQRGEIDVAMIVASWDAPVVRRLLAASGINVLGFARADAYAALYPFVTKLVLPEGVGNMATNRPATDLNLIAPKTNLLVRRDLHPAIQYLLLEAASEIHSAPGIFQKSAQFPAAETLDLPLSEQARQFYRSGKPLLQRYLPFWLAVLANRFLVLLIPLVGVAYPLLRIAPAIYGWNMQRRIFRLYGELKFIELESESRKSGARRDLITRLQRLEDHADRLHVPNSFAPLLYDLRDHITLVRTRVQQASLERGSALLHTVEAHD
ncbi:MAG TPA: TAXI family TRAP transporter solute-binding subunit [Steroidobacteraceae bacterium]|nr:TAXI family TRAP transporter solute-binding subunit [Terriglobales bacterium]HXZ59373.1 TAXI family TRAP transporter solute-binding subunit [Steroidobacteraceae bacterium]